MRIFGAGGSQEETLFLWPEFFLLRRLSATIGNKNVVCWFQKDGSFLLHAGLGFSRFALIPHNNIQNGVPARSAHRSAIELAGRLNSWQGFHCRRKRRAARSVAPIETTGEVFPDGTTLELLRLDPGTGETTLLRWDGESATLGQQFDVNGKIYRAPTLNSTLRALRLPGRVAPYGSTRDLFNDVLKLFIEYTDIAEGHVRKIPFFILGDWLVDRLLVAPFLSVIDPLSVAKAQLLRLLSCLCRRPLLLAEATPAAISGLASLRPTFLLDEPILSRRAERLLYATNNPGRFALRNGLATDVFSAKVICSREPLRDALLVTQALQITLSPAGRQVPFLED